MADTESTTDESLPSTFRTAQELREQVNAGTIPSNNAAPQLVQLLSRCAALVSSLGLFSPNETLEDIATSELQYLLVDFYLGDALNRKGSLVPAERKQTVQAARSAWESFLRRLDQYDILRPEDAKLWERYLDNRSTFEVAAGDATKRRETKINRFKDEKELKRKLEMLKNDPRLSQQDDDITRSLHLADINLRVHETFQNLEFLNLEMQMLSMAPPPQAPGQPVDDRERAKRDAAYSERLDMPHTSLLNRTGPILDASGKPLRPFTLLDKRIQLQDGVFRPDHNLPTMSIDEYLEEERKRGGIIEGGGEKSGIRPEVDEDDLDKADEETMKQRAWDEFKEENPRGSGNTLNRG